MYAPRQKHQNLALFDFDGTLYNQDSFTGFIFYALQKQHIAKRGLKILPWINAYYLKLYPPDKMRARLFYTMFKQQNFVHIQHLAQQYAETLVHQLNQKMLLQLRHHQQQGDRVILVSASVDLYLKPLCEALNIELICTETEVKSLLLTGRYTTYDCSSEQKRLRVLAYCQLNNYTSIYAYGNSHEDQALLSLAHFPFMVGRDSHLPIITPKQSA